MSESMPLELIRKFQEVYGPTTEAIHTFFSPGRVNLIGEHIDYNGGYVFPAALTIGIHAAVKVRSDKQVRVRSVNAEGEFIFPIDKDLKYDPADGWANYPKGIITALAAQGHKLVGADVLYWGNLPDGAGLSSSACIEVLTGYWALTLSKTQNINRVELAKLCQKVENSFIGVNCGIMDMFAVAVGKRNHAMLLDCATLNYQLVPSDIAGYQLIIMNTNKRRELADSKYNERRAECESALAILQKAYPEAGLSDLVAATQDQIEASIADPVLKKRALHVVSENQRVLKAVEVLRAGDIEAFGKLLNASHASLKDDYEVTGLHLDAIVAAAQQQPGCIGARMTGAGFGGCALAVVSEQDVPKFIEHVGAQYTLATQLTASFYISQVGDGVRAQS